MKSVLLATVTVPTLLFGSIAFAQSSAAFEALGTQWRLCVEKQ